MRDCVFSKISFSLFIQVSLHICSSRCACEGGWGSQGRERDGGGTIPRRASWPWPSWRGHWRSWPSSCRVPFSLSGGSLQDWGKGNGGKSTVSVITSYNEKKGYWRTANSFRSARKLSIGFIT